MPHRVITTFWTLVVPLAVLGSSIQVALSWRGRLPDPVATHWDTAGTPNGFAPLSQALWLLVAVVVPLSLFWWSVGYFAGRSAVTRRLTAACAVLVAVTICGIVVGSLAIQRGLDHATHAGGLGPWPGVALAAGVLLALAAARMTPGDEPQPTREPVPASAPRTTMADERWRSTVVASRPWLAVGIGAAAVAVISLATRSRSVAVVLGVVVLALCAVTLRWTVTVDSRGLTARCLLPRPRTFVPLDEIEQVRAVEISPLRHFGGWGYRIGAGGRVGIVVRAGEAILVQRTGGRELVVTVDEARRLAGLLNTLADRSRR